MSIKETKDIRTINRLKILHTIIHNQDISRADTAILTGLNKATVSTIVKELIDLDLIEESTIGESTGGRKPIILTLKPKVGYTIAIDFNISKIVVILADLSLNIWQKHTFPIFSDDVTRTFQTLFKGLHTIIEGIPNCTYGLVGISVAVRGVIDLEGMIRFIPSLDWHNINLKEMMEAEFKVPIFIGNDGNLSAIAEQKNHPHSKELVVVTIDDAISSGIISNGEIIRGFLGFANSIGHHIIDINYPEKCRCGKYGCWEQFCSHAAFLKHIREFIEVDTIEDFIKLVKEDDPIAKECLEHFIKYLSAGIANIIFILNCENIILNSVIFSELPYLVHAIHENISLPITNFQDISISKLGALAPLMGAASISVESFFKRMMDC